jgi:ATP-dependent helicase/nuclease subunit B
VVDYKTGKSDSFKDLSQENPDLSGRKLQLAVYGAAARLHQNEPDAPVRSEFWFVSSKGDFIRIGYLVTDDVLAHVGRTLQTVVTGIERGIFPNHPTATSTSWVECPFCDPDGLGVVELRAQWERKRLQPALALFADLAEPLADVVVNVEEIPGV